MEALGLKLQAEASLATLTEESAQVQRNRRGASQQGSGALGRLRVAWAMDIGALTLAERNVEGVVE